MNERPYYSAALKALEAAHKACFVHEQRPVLGMSHGPFGGVNAVLGMVSAMEREIADLSRHALSLEKIASDSGAKVPQRTSTLEAADFFLTRIK